MGRSDRLCVKDDAQHGESRRRKRPSGSAATITSFTPCRLPGTLTHPLPKPVTLKSASVGCGEPGSRGGDHPPSGTPPSAGCGDALDHQFSATVEEAQRRVPAADARRNLRDGHAYRAVRADVVEHDYGGDRHARRERNRCRQPLVRGAIAGGSRALAAHPSVDRRPGAAPPPSGLLRVPARAGPAGAYGWDGRGQGVDQLDPQLVHLRSTGRASVEVRAEAVGGSSAPST